MVAKQHPTHGYLSSFVLNNTVSLVFLAKDKRIIVGILLREKHFEKRGGLIFMVGPIFFSLKIGHESICISNTHDGSASHN